MQKRLHSPIEATEPALDLNDLMVARPGLEPGTQGFSILCSTNWAIQPNNHPLQNLWKFNEFYILFNTKLNFYETMDEVNNKLFH